MPERILWLVDEYAMKSELPEGLVRMIERVTSPAITEEAHKRAQHSDKGARETQAVA